MLSHCYSVISQELYTQHIINAFEKGTLPQLLISHPDYGEVIIGSGREQVGPYDLFVLRTNNDGEVIEKDTLDRIGIFHIDYSSNYIWLNDTVAAISEYKIAGDLIKNLILIDIKNCRFLEERIFHQFNGTEPYLTLSGIQNYQDNYIIAGYTRDDNTEGNIARYSILDSDFNTIEEYRFQIEERSTAIQEVLNVGDSTIFFFGTTSIKKENGQNYPEIFVARKTGYQEIETIYHKTQQSQIGSANPTEVITLNSGDFMISYNTTYEITEDSFFYDTYIQQKMMRMNQAGEIVWDKVIGLGHPSYADRIYRVIPSNDDENFIYCAEQSSLDFNFQDTVFAGGIYDENGDTISYYGVISKFDENGNEIWHRSYRYWNDLIFGSNEFNDISPLGDKSGYSLVGKSNRRLTSINSTYAWLWEMTVDNYGCLIPGCHLPSSTTNVENEVKLKIYPNPTSDIVYILNDGIFEYRLIDSSGNKLTKMTSTEKDETIILDVSEYPLGLYYISKCKGMNCVTEQLVKR